MQAWAVWTVEFYGIVVYELDAFAELRAALDDLHLDLPHESVQIHGPLDALFIGIAHRWREPLLKHGQLEVFKLAVGEKFVRHRAQLHAHAPHVARIAILLRGVYGHRGGLPLGQLRVAF